MRYLFVLALLVLAGCRPVVIEEHHREPSREIIIERPAPQPVIIERREEPRREIIVEPPRRIEIEIGHDHH